MREIGNVELLNEKQLREKIRELLIEKGFAGYDLCAFWMLNNKLIKVSKKTGGTGK